MANNDLQVMSENIESALNKKLAELQDAGQIKTAELLASLNSVLSDAESGGFVGKAFLGDVLSYTAGLEMPSNLSQDENATHLVDQLELRDVTGDYVKASFAFNASNGGHKAKLAKVKGAKQVLVIYRGEMEPGKKGWNPAKDYGIMEIIDKKVGAELYAFAKSLYPKEKGGK
jgi:hypothetical protein